MADLFVPDDGESPLGQGDIVWVAQAKLVARQEVPASAVAGATPAIGSPSGSRSLLWPDVDAEAEVWVHAVNTIGVVLSPDCAVDKDLHRLAAHLVRTEGLEKDAAYDRAQDDAEMLVQVAEVRTVPDLPEHQRDEVGRLGLIKLETFPGAPTGAGPFAIDLSRVTTVSGRIVEQRMAIATPPMKHKLQAAICQHLAARNIDLTVALTELFTSPMVGVDSLVAPDPGKGKLAMRVRVHFEGGRSAVLDAKLTPEDLPEVPVQPIVQRRHK